jgi:hypothetical protein
MTVLLSFRTLFLLFLVAATAGSVWPTLTGRD